MKHLVLLLISITLSSFAFAESNTDPSICSAVAGEQALDHHARIRGLGDETSKVAQVSHRGLLDPQHAMLGDLYVVDISDESGHSYYSVVLNRTKSEPCKNYSTDKHKAAVILDN